MPGEAHARGDPACRSRLNEGASIGEVVEALRTAKRVSAVCHENPDADTIGAAVAVCIIAERLGAEAEIVSADGIPPMFDFLPHVAQVVRKPHLEPDLAVFCDAATLERVGRIATEEAEWFSRATVLNIDHHISSNYFGDLNLVDPKAAATCEVLARVVDALGIERGRGAGNRPAGGDRARQPGLLRRRDVGRHVARRGAPGRCRRPAGADPSPHPVGAAVRDHRAVGQDAGRRRVRRRATGSCTPR